MKERPVIIATRGSALALAQAHFVLAQCRQNFPRLEFELKIIKTTGDKLQTASLSQPGSALSRGLFTKELEIALVKQKADIAVHSLKDLPTDLPSELALGCVAGQRADVRDVLIYRAAGGTARGFAPGARLKDFPPGAVIATSSSRRRAQLLAARADCPTVEIRGNVPTRLEKLALNPEIDATVLAAAGLARLNFTLDSGGRLLGDAVPAGLLAVFMELDEMLPCVGQGALGIELRADDDRIRKICRPLNHHDTFQSVTAERSFLQSIGGGCQTPVAAYACVENDKLHLRALSFLENQTRRAESQAKPFEAVELGAKVGRMIMGPA